MRTIFTQKEVDEFSAYVLIPPAEYRAFIRKDTLTQSDVVSFAKSIGVDPGIVFGRLFTIR